MNTEHWIVYSSIQRGNVFISVYIYCVSVKFTIQIHFHISQNLVENEISLPKRHSSSSILCGWNCYSGIHLNYFTWQAGSGKEWRERERERERGTNWVRGGFLLFWTLAGTALTGPPDWGYSCHTVPTCQPLPFYQAAGTNWIVWRTGD